MREALDDPAVDVVSIATPHHWHSLAAIWAMQAGKDVYVEKPVSHNVSEGRRCVEAARKYNRICQTGTQCRSMPGMREAMQYLHDGKMGDVKLARGLCYKERESIGRAASTRYRRAVDYSLWLGPAPEAAAHAKAISLRLALAMALRQRRPGKPGRPPDGHRPLGTGPRPDCRERVVSYGGRVGYDHRTPATRPTRKS